MSAIRADNAARDLLARLTDEAELESAPIGEVRAYLASLGVDSARSIRFSQRLAEEAALPAGGLLARTLVAEADDREISALESADLSAVRAELSAATPLASARAQQLATQVAGSPRRRASRRLWYGVGGAITAIAASVLIFVEISSPELEPQQIAFAPQEELEIPAMRKKEVPKPALPASDVAPSTSAAAPISTGDSRREINVPTLDEQRAAERNRLELELSRLLSGGTDSGAGSLGGLRRLEDQFGDLRATAALILQPELAPEPLRQSDLGEGNLMSRLPDAARSAAHKSIVALVTLEKVDGTTVDVMLLHLPAQYLRQADATPPYGEVEPSGSGQPQAAPLTLRQLLGKDIDEFNLIEMKPPTAAGLK